MRKSRRQKRLFVAEGTKLVGDLLNTMRPSYVAALPQWIDMHRDLLADTPVDEITPAELERASLLRAPQEVIALFPIPDYLLDTESRKGKLTLALDGVQDPGNLGTIVRIADWFGIEDILCSMDTADIYNPKAIQATMGAIARVRLHYVDLPDMLSQTSLPIYGTFLDGENLYDKQLSPEGIIVMGNEGKGITKEVGEKVSKRLFIPSYPAQRETSESLNVAIATSIVCAEFRRRQQ